MLIVGLYSIKQISWFSLPNRGRMKGTFVYLGPIEVAAFFNQYGVMLLGIYFMMKRSIKKQYILALSIIDFYCVFFLFSRGAYVGLVSGLFSLFAIRKRLLLIPLINIFHEVG